MGIEGVPLNACPLGHHADRGQGRSNTAVQIDRRFDNSLPGLCLLFGAAT
jgi:hypothetical protein